MVRKIQGSEYLRRYDNMTAQEREAYESRVELWLSDNAEMLIEKGEVFEARLQNVLQVSGAWNDQECQAFEEGARLLSATVPTVDTWLPDMLYVKSAKRAIKRMFEVLRSVAEGADAAENTHGMRGENGYGMRREKPDADAMEIVAAADTTEVVADATPFQEGAGDGAVCSGDNEGEIQVGDGENAAGAQGDKPDADTTGVVAPARPKSIHQYVHLLPKKTQEHAALVQGLYRELDEARRKLDLLMNDKTASPADREAWAKKATKCDNTLRKIFDELDAEWAKLAESGRVVVDDLGNARVVSSSQNDEAQDQTSAELTTEQRARRRELRKWLTDTRRGNGAGREERVKQWKFNFKEYLTFEGDAAFKDEKILEAAKHYGIELGDETAEHGKTEE